MIAITRVFLGTVSGQVSLTGLSSKYLLIKVTPLQTNGNTPQFPDVVNIKQQIDINGEITILTEQEYPINTVNRFLHLNNSVIYDLVITLPEWYSQVELKVGDLQGINYDPVNPGDNVIDLTNFYNRPEVDGLLALKANLSDIPNLANYAPVDHNHDNLYFRKDAIAVMLDELESQILAIPPSSSSLKILSLPAYAISSHPNGHPQWGGPMAGAFDATAQGTWNTPDGGTNAWIGQTFPSPVKIKEVRFRTGYGEGNRDEARVIRQYRIESSNDLSGPWNSYGIRYTQATPFSQYLSVINEPLEHLYWRLFVVQGSTAFVCGIQDLQFLG